MFSQCTAPITVAQPHPLRWYLPLPGFRRCPMCLWMLIVMLITKGQQALIGVCPIAVHKQLKVLEFGEDLSLSGKDVSWYELQEKLSLSQSPRLPKPNSVQQEKIRRFLMVMVPLCLHCVLRANLSHQKLTCVGHFICIQVLILCPTVTHSPFTPAWKLCEVSGRVHG